MAEAADGAFELGLRIAGSLDRAGIPYALGGALAFGVWAVPRLTLDVDVNVFVEEDGLPGVLAALASAGVEADAQAALREAREQGMFVGRGSGMRVDVFTPSIDFSWEAMRTRVRIDRGGQPIWVLSAEALCVFKLLFFRGKDVVDLERLVAMRGAELDVRYVRSKLAEMMGEDDPRVATWDRLTGDQGRSTR